MNIFEVATKKKFRFPFRGLITVEDLYDLTMAQLDVVYGALTEEANNVPRESLLSDNTPEDEDLRIKIEIVKYIFNEKQEAAKRFEMERANADKKQRLLEILAKKQEDSLQNMSEDELKKMIEELG